MMEMLREEAQELDRKESKALTLQLHSLVLSRTATLAVYSTELLGQFQFE